MKTCFVGVFLIRSDDEENGVAVWGSLEVDENNAAAKFEKSERAVGKHDARRCIESILELLKRGVEQGDIVARSDDDYRTIYSFADESGEPVFPFTRHYRLPNAEGVITFFFD